jgi:hypothetical protein
MHTLNYLRPRRLEEHGNQQASVARDLLKIHGAGLSPSNRDTVEGLLDHAEDFRQVLRGKKCLLARIRLARRYDKKASKARGKIESMLVLSLRSINRPSHS